MSTEKKIAGGTADDREYYEAALEFADAFYAGFRKLESVGVHLVFVEDFSHPSLTSAGPSTTAFLPGNQIWSRMYPVVLKGKRRRSRDKEFAFFFRFRGEFSSFLRSAHHMDRLVLSFERE